MNVNEVIKRNREIEARNRKRGSSSASRIVSRVEKGGASFEQQLMLRKKKKNTGCDEDSKIVGSLFGNHNIPCHKRLITAGP
jgi:hypothetical protein